MKGAIFLAVLGLAVGADALVYEQANTGYSNIVSQDFTDYPDFSTYSSDDVSGLGHVRITGARAWGTEAGLSSEKDEVVLGIGKTDYYDSIFLRGYGTQAGADLVFSDLDIEVTGEFHFFVWVVRPFDTGGQWFWNVTQTVTGDQLRLHNPGAGFGFGLGTFGISDILGERLDGSFRIEYELVPEPATLIGMGLGGFAAFGRRRRK